MNLLATDHDKTLTVNKVKTDPKSLMEYVPNKVVAFNIMPATKAARIWLNLLDQSKYASCWEQASVLVRKSISKEAFIKQATRSRQPLGTFMERTVFFIQPKTNLPGAPKGKYVLIKFNSIFSNKEKTTETLIIQQDPNNSWRVAGYFIL